MRYYELFESDDTKSSLANAVMDILTPIAANGVDYVTVDQIIGKLQHIPTGLMIDRELIMDVLDPNQFPLIKSIEGDKVYLKAKETARSVSDDQKDTEAEKIKDTAAKKAVQDVKDL